jgi:hypothetical protein
MSDQRWFLALVLVHPRRVCGYVWLSWISKSECTVRCPVDFSSYGWRTVGVCVLAGIFGAVGWLHRPWVVWCFLSTSLYGAVDLSDLSLPDLVSLLA